MPPQAKKVQAQTEAARKLLKTAPDILQDVDNAYIFKSYETREIPSFEKSELSFGPILGVGGFCFVTEVRAIKLKSSPASATESVSEEKEKVAAESRNQSPSVLEEDDSKFYETSTARGYMSTHFRRDGDARYAIKFLRTDLTKLEDARAKIDLAIEAKYLSIVSHPNIIKMRGWAAGDPLDDWYFIVLDRLYDTLQVRMEQWKETKKKATGGPFGFGTNKDALQDLMEERLLVAYDLSSAFGYIAENKMVYRDIKPENIGFDVRGDVKVFDFGLCKSLHPKLKTKGGMFKLTGRTGSFPYMAPEIAQCLPYNCSSDVFSFGIMLWEMLALKPAFGRNLTRKQYYEKVSLGGERPEVSSKWPPQTREMMQDAWNADTKVRPAFKRMSTVIRADLEDMMHDSEAIRNRTKQLQRRSVLSLHGLRDSVEVAEGIVASSNRHDGCTSLTSAQESSC